MCEDKERSVSLLELYFKKRETLLADLKHSDPVTTADQVSHFVIGLERPYTDMGLLTDDQARSLPHILGIIAGMAKITASVDIFAYPHKSINDQDSSQKGFWRFLFRDKKVNSGGSGLTTLFYFWGTALVSVIAITLVWYTNMVIVAIVAFFIIAMLAVSGATISQRSNIDHSKEPFLSHSEITLSTDLNKVDGRLVDAFRSADVLLSSLGYTKLKEDNLKFDSDLMFDLLQALSAHSMVNVPEKTAKNLGKDAIRLLQLARFYTVKYSPSNAELFDEQPAGVEENRLLLPALVDENRKLVRKGIVLIPVQKFDR